MSKQAATKEHKFVVTHEITEEFAYVVGEYDTKSAAENAANFWNSISKRGTHTVRPK